MSMTVPDGLTRDTFNVGHVSPNIEQLLGFIARDEAMRVSRLLEMQSKAKTTLKSAQNLPV